EDLRRLVLVPARAPERLVDEAILEVGEHLVEIHAFGRQRGGDLVPCSVGRRLADRRVADRSREIGDADLSLSLEHREPLDEVLQLANVAWPRMTLERGHGLL